MNIGMKTLLFLLIYAIIVAIICISRRSQQLSTKNKRSVLTTFNQTETKGDRDRQGAERGERERQTQNV